jgi:nucleotide-binding universal stress UspA family protein
MAIEEKSTADECDINSKKVQIRKILVPIDGSECSLYAAKHAVKLAKDENAKLFCIHVIGSIPYGYRLDGYAVQQYLESV